MAQIVDYFQDLGKDEYAEGPFVVCQIRAHDCRLEVFLDGHKCSILPNVSIYKHCDKEGKKTRGSVRAISNTVDYLNDLVKQGIVKPNEFGIYEI